jgi:LSD1 subclass zinc finger protein
MGNEIDYSASMAVDPALLEILVCPECKTPVELVKGGTALRCHTCRRVYPIEDDIPVMLVDEATIEN